MPAKILAICSGIAGLALLFNIENPLYSNMPPANVQKQAATSSK